MKRRCSADPRGRRSGVVILVATLGQTCQGNPRTKWKFSWKIIDVNGEFSIAMFDLDGIWWFTPGIGCRS